MIIVRYLVNNIGKGAKYSSLFYIVEVRLVKIAISSLDICTNI